MHYPEAPLSEKLAKADEDAIREVVREAEAYLQAQLQSALASDARAMTFASVLTAAIAVVVGGSATIITTLKSPEAVWGSAFLLPMVVCLIVALHYAASAAQPTIFYYAGNDPSEWCDDFGCGKSLSVMLAEQAALYSKSIEKNAKIMKDNCEDLRCAMGSAFVGIIYGICCLAILAAYAYSIILRN